MTRSKRHAQILDLIASKNIETQDELTELLKKGGYDITQATVSRDIKELGLVKTVAENGVYKYSTNAQTSKISSRRIALFKGAVISVEYAENIIVIKTISGSASSAAALIDSLKEPSILGSVAGDDTIFIVVKDKDAIEGIIEKFNAYID
ncbi:MAG: arginine repressor [Clostridiales bacterium]|jgi:transcriptional regulator of arginine metabolism|nr:arginine repressor [Clostridiales bacterium]